jgi:RimJ/RimL family protein N-acetyltransferase
VLERALYGALGGMSNRLNTPVAKHDHLVAAPKELLTGRLRLRRWRDSDREPFAALNADPEVMEFYPAPLSRAQSDATVDRIEELFEARAFGLWAVDVIATNTFAGYVGLCPATFDAHFTPAVEVGWRLARFSWGFGYATEAARAATADVFVRMGLEEIVSFTAVINRRSQRVMEKLGMTHDPGDDFGHPALAEGHPLRPHVLYRLTASQATTSVRLRP